MYLWLIILQTVSKGLVKVEGARSNLLKQVGSKGFPFGPFIYNVLSNDLFYVVSDQCDIFNYAKDNYIYLNVLSTRILINVQLYCTDAIYKT